MARKEALSIHTQVGDVDLSLEARAGESLRVVGVYVDTPAADHVTLRTGKTTVGYFRVGGAQGNQLFFPTGEGCEPNLLDFLFQRGLFQGYPVPEGQTFVVEGAKQSTSKQAVLYETYEAGDMKAEMPNGPAASVYEFMQLGRYSTTLADGDNLYATQQTTVEFPGFPFGEAAPQGRRVSILALCLSDFARTGSGAADKQVTTYLKLIKERVVLYDRERNGLICYGVAPAAEDTAIAVGCSLLGNRTDEDLSVPLVLEEPIICQGGQELDVYVTTDLELGSSVVLLAADAEVGLWMLVEPEGGVR